MNVLKKILFAVSVAAVLVFSGCSNQIQNDVGLTYISGISIGNVNARTALPEPDVELSDFVLNGSYNGGTSKKLGSWATKEALSSAKIAVQEGKWSFTLTAKCGAAILTGQTDKSIVTGNNTLDFILSYTSYGSSSNKGAFEVSIKVPETVKAVKAGLYSTSDTVVYGYQDELLTIDENRIACYKKIEVPVYNRIVKFSLYGDEEATLLLNTVKDVVVIAASSLSTDYIEIESVNDVYEITLENLKETDTLNGNFKKFYTRRNDVTLPVPQRANHTFLGWFEDDTKVENWKAGERLSDVTFTAKWQYDSKVTPKGMPSSDSVKLTWTVPENDDFFKETVISFEGNKIVIGKDEPAEYDVTGLTPEKDYIFYFTAVSVDGLEGKEIRIISTPGEGFVSVADLADYLEANKAKEVIPVRITDSEITEEEADVLNGLFKNNSIKVSLDLSLVDSIKISESYYCKDWVSIVKLKLGGHIETTSYTSKLFSEMDNLKSLVIADDTYIYINGSYMFYSADNLETLVIGDNCYIESSYMFENSGLKTVEVGNNVEFSEYTFAGAEKLESVSYGEGCEVGDYAFKSCYALNEVNLPEGITKIPARCFQYSGITSLSIPETVTEIGDAAFEGCMNLESIFLPESVKALKYAAFMECKKLKSIDLSYITNYGSHVFEGSGLECVEMPLGTSLGSDMFKDCVDLKKVVIGDNFTYVHSSAFSGCTNLATVVLGEGIQYIDDNAFKDCTSLEYIYFPKNVNKISGSAFVNCENITFEVSEENKYFSTSEDGKMVMNKAQTTLVLFPGAQGDISETFPDTLVLGEGAFKNNSKITKVKLPGGMKSVPKDCFYDCSALEEVDLNNATEIGYDAFISCESLVSIDLSKVTFIDGYAFWGCTELTNIDLSSAKIIKSSAFQMSHNNGGQPNIGKLGDIDLSSIEELGAYVFQDAGLKNVILPDNFNNYKESKKRLYGAFAKNPDLKFILSDNAENFTTAEDGKILLSKDKKVLVAYPGASGEITIPDYIETIGAYAFDHSDITGITIPSNVKTVEGFAFYYTFALERIDIEEGLERIEQDGFYFCGNGNLLLTIPSSVTYIGNNGLQLYNGYIALIETDGWTTTYYKDSEDHFDYTKYDLSKDYVWKNLFGNSYKTDTGHYCCEYIWTREPSGTTE